MVAAGVTGSAIVIPLLAAASASAADGTTWDRVAQCESGGAWSADQGNGYYGGLQLDQENWEAHGGLDYAPRADQASRSQQIAVAEKVLADKGLAAWPTCGPLSGLSKDAAGVSVDTGVAGDASNDEDESGSYVSSGLATSPSTSPSDAPSASSGSDDSSDVAGSTAEPSASPSSDGSGAATGKGEKSPKSGNKDASSSPSDASSAGTGRHRGGDAAESATGGGADSASGRHAASASSDTAYVADVIDNLRKVSDGLGLGGGWVDLPTADAAATDSGPGPVVPGQSIADTAETVQN